MANGSSLYSDEVDEESTYQGLPAYAETLAPSDLNWLDRLRNSKMGHRLLGPTPLEQDIGMQPYSDPGIIPTLTASPMPFGIPGNFAKVVKQIALQEILLRLFGKRQ